MELLGMEIRDHTNPNVEGLPVCIDMRNEIEVWLKNPGLYKLEDCSKDPNTRNVLKIFRKIQELTDATSVKMIEYFYNLEQKVQNLRIDLATLDTTLDNWITHGE